MSDTRLPFEWIADRRIRRLTDRSFRAFIHALMWSVETKTDGVIETEDLDLIPGWIDGCEDELVASTVWQEIDRGWFITVFPGSQTSKAEHEVLAKAREANRIKQANWRARQKENGVTGDVTVTGVTGTPQVGRQAGRQVPAYLLNNSHNSQDSASYPQLVAECALCDEYGWVRNTDPPRKCRHQKVRLV